jgi:uncharacterized protein YdcH (DUF465 family)
MLKLWNTIKVILNMAREFDAMKTKIEELQHEINRMGDYVPSYDFELLLERFEKLQKDHDSLDRSVTRLYSDRI